jgi:hypothetical protein
MPPGMPGGAMCVQRFDDSLNSAIHITYRISLRSSSMREPRDPLLKVFFFVSSLVPSSLARWPSDGGGDGGLGRIVCSWTSPGGRPGEATVVCTRRVWGLGNAAWREGGGGGSRSQAAGLRLTVGRQGRPTAPQPGPRSWSGSPGLGLATRYPAAFLQVSSSTESDF